MSDFVNSGWSIFVAVATVLGLLACLWLLYVASHREPMAADNSTGHVFDHDLVEMNNPLPRWWAVLFVLTVVFSFGYVAVYPGLGNMAGLFGWTSKNQYEAERQAAGQAMAKVYADFKDLPAAQMSRHPQAMATGERLFINHCSSCHGSDARGSKGFPNLTDSDWLYGGTPEKIAESITLGRQGVMPALAAAVGTPADLGNLAQHVLRLSGSAHNAAAADAGQSKFALCAACHGAAGEGNQALGAPRLSDKVWLHGWGQEAIVQIVTHGKTNVMPAQGERLLPEQIQVLAAYVWSLSQPGVRPGAQPVVQSMALPARTP